MPRNQSRKKRCERHPDQQIRHPLSEAGVRPVASVADPRLQEESEIVVYRHHKADQRDAFQEILQEQRNEGIVQRPSHADAEEAKPEQPSFPHPATIPFFFNISWSRSG